MLKKTKRELIIPIFPARVICVISANLITLPAFLCRSLAVRVAELRRCVLTLLLPEDHGCKKGAFLGENPAKWKGVELTWQRKTDLKKKVHLLADALTVNCFQWLY